MKKIIILFLILLFFSPAVYAEDSSQEQILEQQKEDLNISDFIEEAQQYTDTEFADLDVNELLSEALTGKIENNNFWQNLLSVFGKEVKESLTILGSILAIIIIHSIIKSIGESLENENVAKITYYVQYILIAVLIISSFSNVVEMVRESVQNMIGFTQCLIPLLMTLLLTTGSITSAGILQPILLFTISFIANLFQVLILPAVLISTALAIVSKLSDKIQIDKIAKFMKSSTIWIMGIILTIFVAILSVEGTLSSSVDGITAKTAKAAVSNVIPVVGKVLGDAVDTVIGCSSILKNAVGVVGIIVILSICIVPIIKLAILTIAYHLTAALAEPISDGKIVKLLEQMGDTFKILLAILCVMAVIFIIGLTLVVKISNSGLMYR